MIVGSKNIAVIGMGYVGIPMAVLLADAGNNVIGIQRRSERSGWKIDWLNTILPVILASPLSRLAAFVKKVKVDSH